MSQFAILIDEGEAGWAHGGPEVEQASKEHTAFNERDRPTSVVVGGNALQPTFTGRSIQPDGSVTDGPSLETKEALGGFYLVEAADLDEAIEIAQQVPHPFGGLEVRPRPGHRVNDVAKYLGGGQPGGRRGLPGPHGIRRSSPLGDPRRRGAVAHIDGDVDLAERRRQPHGHRRALRETKESVGGFYLLEADDLDEAIVLAKRVPAPWGGVEVRPGQVFG